MLARHMLLLSVLLDTEVPVRQRSELFLELYNNASIQATTAEYLGRLQLALGTYHAQLPVHTCAAILDHRHVCADHAADCLAPGPLQHQHAV